MSKKRVGVVFGGRSGEHEISLISARSVIRAMDPSRYAIVPIGITTEGLWLDSEASRRLLLSSGGDDLVNVPFSSSGAGHYGSGRVPPPSLFAGLDVVFPVLHGPYGEDGCVQGLLEMADVAYVGAGVAGSAVGMDKGLQKMLLRAAGLPTPHARAVLRSEWEAAPAAVLTGIAGEFGFPCFVKPANLGSSVGISKAKDRESLARAFDEAARLDRKILVEQAIDGREIECAVLGNDEPEASVIGEIIPPGEFYDYEAKYHDDRTQLRVPAVIPDETAEACRALALRTFRALDCAGMGRVDFFLDRNSGVVYVNEINTIPGFTSVSMYPRLWEASGLPYPQLIDRLIALAEERCQDRRRSVRTTRQDE